MSMGIDAQGDGGGSQEREREKEKLGLIEKQRGKPGHEPDWLKCLEIYLRSPFEKQK